MEFKDKNVVSPGGGRECNPRSSAWRNFSRARPSMSASGTTSKNLIPCLGETGSFSFRSHAMLRSCGELENE